MTCRRRRCGETPTSSFLWQKTKQISSVPHVHGGSSKFVALLFGVTTHLLLVFTLVLPHLQHHHNVCLGFKTENRRTII